MRSNQCSCIKTLGTPEHADENCANSVGSSLTYREKSKFSGVFARINYLAQDRADEQFAVQDLCRHMASPEVKGKPRAIQHFAFGKIAPQLDCFSERPSTKSTSGGILMWGGCLIKSWSSTQTTISLSSAEVELCAVRRCVQHASSLVSVASDLDVELHPTIHTDASAVLSIAYRSGACGRTWHVKVQYLSVKGAVSRKDSRVARVGTSENPADVLTKFLSAVSLGRNSKNVGCEFPADNFQVRKARDNLAACSELEVRFKNFAKHLGIARTQEVDHEPTTFERNTEAVLCYDFSKFGMFSSIVCSD